MTPTYMSGPLFVRTSKRRQRFGQRVGLPGRGSLGQIQPRVVCCPILCSGEILRGGRLDKVNW